MVTKKLEIVGGPSVFDLGVALLHHDTVNETRLHLVAFAIQKIKGFDVEKAEGIIEKISVLIQGMKRLGGNSYDFHSWELEGSVGKWTSDELIRGWNIKRENLDKKSWVGNDLPCFSFKATYDSDKRTGTITLTI